VPFIFIEGYSNLFTNTWQGISWIIFHNWKLLIHQEKHTRINTQASLRESELHEIASWMFILWSFSYIYDIFPVTFSCDCFLWMFFLYINLGFISCNILLCNLLLNTLWLYSYIICDFISCNFFTM